MGNDGDADGTSPLRTARKRQVVKAFESRADADAFAAAMEDDVRRGQYHDPAQGSACSRTWLGEWMRSKLDVRQSTLARYELELRLYVLPTWAGEPLSAITVSGVRFSLGARKNVGITTIYGSCTILV